MLLLHYISDFSPRRLLGLQYAPISKENEGEFFLDINHLNDQMHEMTYIYEKVKHQFQ